jgi:hypothetical protein
LNKHITENINYYLELEKPEYALLLSGKWGSGKTYFINDFVDSYTNEANKKIIKISLFGLKNVDSIDEQIFQNLHPILGSKYAKLTGNIVKSAFKLGINLDWNGDGKKDAALSTDLKSFNLLEFFSDKEKENKEIIFIFDDLERTGVSLQEILGYINYLIELSSFKVILIANEEKLLEKDNEKVYKEFKEKVIGKTFEVRHDFSDILDFFLNDRLIEIHQFKKQIIKDVYDRAGYNNLRHIKQSIIDFKHLIDKINPDFLNSDEFLSKFTYIFFVLSIEVKNGSLEEKDFKAYNALLKYGQASEKKEESSIDLILKKYHLDSQFLLTREVWIKIIYKSYIDESELNISIKNLPFFVEEKKRPSWVKLWHYRELEDAEFSEILNDVIEEFKTNSYRTPEIFLHTIALLIFFNKNNISPFKVDDIKNHVKDGVNIYSTLEWKSNTLMNDMQFNGTGFCYMNDIDPDFRELFEIIKTKSNEIHEKYDKTEIIDNLHLFLEAVKKDDKDYICNFLLNKNEYSPVFRYLNPDDFFNTLIESSNKSVSKLLEILNYRYADNKTLNGNSCFYFLNSELEFWEKIKLKVSSYDDLPLKSLLFKQFEKYLIDVVVNKMNQEINSK